MDNLQPPKIHAETILLKESFFKLHLNSAVEQPTVTNMQIKVISHINGNELVTELACNVISNLEKTDELVFEAKVTMAGVFRKVGDGNLDMETFSKVNAPAIIFPYVREMVSNLTMRSGIPTIILPPTNFQALAAMQAEK